MISFRQRGGNKDKKFFEDLKRAARLQVLEKYARIGVVALSSATPVDTGLTAASWDYEIVEDGDKTSIVFTNSNTVGGYTNVAILIQMGHATGTGGWVEGRDYINPVIQPLFDHIVNEAWKEVTSI